METHSFFMGEIRMKYQTAFNVWDMPAAFYKHIQVGQWVYAGDKSNKGIFLGIKKSGSVVVAWYGNAKNRSNYREYLKALHTYAKGE
jgi:hypothetical protein